METNQPMTPRIPDEVREKIDTESQNRDHYDPSDYASCRERKGFLRGGNYAYSLALPELETFKDAYVERNDECNRLKAELEVLKAENERLKQWKKEAMPMMEDFQAIAKALGIPLGQSIHDKILPGIEAKNKEIERLKGLVEKVDKGWHITFYRATSTMTAREIENFYNEKLPQFKQQHNL